MCEMHLEIPKFDVAPIVIRYCVTGVLVSNTCKAMNVMTDK